MSDPRHHDRWIRIGNWRDSRDYRAGMRQSGLSQVADFRASIGERYAPGSSWRRPEREFAWQVVRQRTEREGPDKRGQHWEGPYAMGTEPTLAKAKTAATAALREHRMAHILAGATSATGTRRPVRRSARRRDAPGRRGPTPGCLMTARRRSGRKRDDTG